VEASVQTPEDGVSPPAFCLAPASWYYFGTVEELLRGPRRLELSADQQFVAFRERDRPAVVLSGRCSHMGADLSRGCVKNGRIACPLHGWEYRSDGKCEHIPALATIPSFARQTAFPVEERGGHVFFFNRAEARFPLPFFEGKRDTDLHAARCFEFTVNAPWYLVSGNGFDVQHFRTAHDRTLVGEVMVDSPHALARRLRARFRVTGDSWRDWMTRRFCGTEMEMTVENWCGNLVFVTSKSQRTCTYGLVSFVPLDKDRTWIRDIVWIPRRKNALARRWLDPLDAMLRSYFIREFVRSDVDGSDGLRFRPKRMTPADKELVEYLAWLQNIHH
jgi:phenylpropionate dioxygenase-like ring-hydroxylating dioxygenase large terminal subunit